MRELSDVSQLSDATETTTDRLVHLQRRRTSCTPTPPLDVSGPESVVSARSCLPRLKIDRAAKIDLGGVEGSFARTALDGIHARHH